jgi:phosphoribosylformimino-5-aminoimidazole carboxamide ribotide isomerase
MRIVPVLDLMGGRVVRGVAGRRSEYRPVAGPLTASSQPLGVARAFRLRFGLTELYVADLDAISGAEPALDLYADLVRDGFRLWIDAGVRRMDHVRLMADGGADGVVVGLETAGPAVLADACAAFGPRILFSLDMKAGKPLGDAGAWGAADARPIAKKALALGARRMIVLDLARVGTGRGIGTEALCAVLAEEHPAVELIAGGGVGGPEDLRRLSACGVRAALVASALHDGRLRREDWERL